LVPLNIYGMNNVKFTYVYGATPLDLDELTGIIPSHLTLQSQLNEWEQANITDAELWLGKQKLHEPQKILSPTFLLRLHKHMFDCTWRWAGQFRKSNKNIGIEWSEISHHLQLLLGDVNFQIHHASYEKDEIVARFHHRLVSIQPFSNGNGRHARLSADVLLLSLKQPRFSWGKNSLLENNQTRKNYIHALRAADKGAYKLLIEFVRG
jgi:Fic-DOC domain mobile mystery protein B